MLFLIYLFAVTYTDKYCISCNYSSRNNQTDFLQGTTMDSWKKTWYSFIVCHSDLFIKHSDDVRLFISLYDFHYFANFFKPTKMISTEICILFVFSNSLVIYVDSFLNTRWLPLRTAALFWSFKLSSNCLRLGFPTASLKAVQTWVNSSGFLLVFMILRRSKKSKKKNWWIRISWRRESKLQAILWM